MKKIKQIVFRYLTYAEFFNIYKPRGTEPGGGGQKYIDFPKSRVRLAQWNDFFSDIPGIELTEGTQGSRWDVPIFSIGTSQSSAQQVIIYQRRQASVCVGAQHIHSAGQNRVLAWHPDNGFPEPDEPTDRHQLPRGLAVFLVRTYEDEIWAGWFRNDTGLPSPCENTYAEDLLQPLLLENNSPGNAGFITLDDGELLLNDQNKVSPFISTHPSALTPESSTEQQAELPLDVSQEPEEGVRIAPPTTTPRHRRRRPRTEGEITRDLFNEDDDIEAEQDSGDRTAIVRIRRRNERAVRNLKQLYKKCQIRGTDYLFRKTNGDYYTEAHHLIPLAEGGADNPRNMIIVGPLIHRMLHYANVSGVDISKIEERPDGSAELRIKINGVDYTIVWHPGHAEKILEQQE